MTYTIDELESLCGELGLYSKRSGDALVVPMTRAEDPERPIYNVFLADCDKNFLRAYAISVGFTIDEQKQFEAMVLCNKWNRERSFARAYVDRDGELRLELDFEGEGIPKEYARENFIREFTAASGDFFEWASTAF